MSETVNIYTKLQLIQQALRVPKDQNNEFAGFKYRSAESIIEKLKPLLKEHGLVLILTDVVEDHAEQSYVRATAKLFSCIEPEASIEVSALAREEKTRPKMSEGQLTGAASSYARKYALNGLLLLDDNKDPDSQDNRAQTPQQAPQTVHRVVADPVISKPQASMLLGKAKHASGLTDRDDLLEFFELETGVAINKVKQSDVARIEAAFGRVEVQS